jgi:hypothetical protein
VSDSPIFIFSAFAVTTKSAGLTGILKINIDDTELEFIFSSFSSTETRVTQLNHVETILVRFSLSSENTILQFETEYA